MWTRYRVREETYTLIKYLVVDWCTLQRWHNFNKTSTTSFELTIQFQSLAFYLSTFINFNKHILRKLFTCININWWIAQDVGLTSLDDFSWKETMNFQKLSRYSSFAMNSVIGCRAINRYKFLDWNLFYNMGLSPKSEASKSRLIYFGDVRP